MNASVDRSLTRGVQFLLLLSFFASSLVYQRGAIRQDRAAVDNSVGFSVTVGEPAGALLKLGG